MPEKIVIKNRIELVKRLGLAGKECVEIGVLRGDFSQVIASQRPKMLYLVDPWARNKVYNMPREKDFLRTALRFKDNPCVKIIRKSSFDASFEFENKSIDFVYIDGEHSPTYFVADLYMWYPKVRTGGWLSGHDYGLPGYSIERNVAEFCQVTGEKLAHLTVCDLQHGRVVIKSWAIQKSR